MGGNTARSRHEAPNTIVACTKMRKKVKQKQIYKSFAAILDRIWAHQYVARDFKGA